MVSKSDERVIVLVDMDCFYVQVEQKLCPEYFQKPCAVVQYKTWKGGGIIAVNYEARARGVTRFLRGDEAQKLCPDIHLFRVPEIRGKADLTRYREAGAKVLDVLCEYSDCVERASIDEAYLDMTAIINSKMQNSVSPSQISNTFVVGWGDDEETRKAEVPKWLKMLHEEEHLYSDKMLAIAAVIVEEMRAAVFSKTGYRCSAGIAHNKMLAKLSCGLHKPNKQTVLPQASIQLLYNTIPVKKVRNLGGKLGKEVVDKFGVETMGELFNISKSKFVSAFGEKTGTWLHNIARGIENELVIARQLPKSIGCGKNFPGKASLSTKDQVMHWLTQLCSELEERLLKDKESNQRIAHLLTINVRSRGSDGYAIVSRSCPIFLYNAQKLTNDAFAAIQKLNTASSSLWNPPICSLAISASKFEDNVSTGTDIQSYFSLNDTPAKNGENSEKTIEIDRNSESAKEVSYRREETVHKQIGKKAKTNIANFFSSNNDVNLLDSNMALKTKCSEVSIESGMIHVKDCELKNMDSLISNDVIKNCSTTEEQQNLTNFPSKEVKGFFARKLAEYNSKKSTIEMSATLSKSMHCNDENDSANKLKPDSKIVCPSIIEKSDYRDALLVPSTSKEHFDLDPELTKLCSKCNSYIPIWEEDEHLDYHMALDLSKEFRSQSKNEMPTTNFASGSAKKSFVTQKSKRSNKRNVKSKMSSNPKKRSLQNTLDSFIKS